METEDIDSLNALEEERNHLIASKEEINKQKVSLDRSRNFLEYKEEVRFYLITKLGRVGSFFEESISI